MHQIKLIFRHPPILCISILTVLSTFKIHSKFIFPCYYLSATLHPLAQTSLQQAPNWVSLLTFSNLMPYPAIWMRLLHLRQTRSFSCSKSFLRDSCHTRKKSYIDHDLQGHLKTDSSSLITLLVHATPATWASLLFPVHVRHASPSVQNALFFQRSMWLFSSFILFPFYSEATPQRSLSQVLPKQPSWAFLVSLSLTLHF